MNNYKVILKIILWVETIAAARILLFSVPVLISKCMAEELAPHSVTDWFMIILTIVGLLYLLTGLASIMGQKLWIMYHFIVCAVALLMSARLYLLILATGNAVSLNYFIPAACSVAMTVLLLVLNGKTKLATS